MRNYSPNTTLSTYINQLHLSAIYGHHQAYFFSLRIFLLKKKLKTYVTHTNFPNFLASPIFTYTILYINLQPYFNVRRDLFLKILLCCILVLFYL